ncbi:MAG TPA: sigma-70 family RNA polymerase sigma factor [Saprospiraceae bacterium]|nr:sigma-70 family RNA polymerase sigma factor [Saprospiraceae bacterium]
MPAALTSQTLTDSELIKRIQSGEKALYEVIVRRYNPWLYKTCRAYGYNHQDTQDLMQEAYISAYNGLPGFEYRSSLKTWLIRILLNHCYHKKQKMNTQKEQFPNGALRQNSKSAYTMDHHISSKELGHVIEQALARIPEDYRIAFAMRELNGLNVAETAELLNISEGNVKVRLNRAKNMLRKEIERTYSPDEIYEFNLVYCDRIVERVMAVVNA